MEVVLSHDGDSVELSILGEAPAWPKYSKRQLRLKLPLERFQNTTFNGVTGTSRSGHVFRNGVFNDKLEKGLLLNQLWRFLALDGGKDKKVIFDFDPIGPTNSCPQYPVGVIYGFARLDFQGNALDVICGSDTKEEGGFTGAKIVLREGVIEDFSKIHVLPHYHYNQHVTPLFYDSFGAENTGKHYQHLDTARFDEAAKHGWTAGESLRKVTGTDGALYSHVAGSNGVLKYELPGNGLYLLCFYMGNSNKTANSFSLGINGRRYLENITVPDGRIAMVSVPVWITDKRAVIEFIGDFILSTVSVQYFISDFGETAVAAFATYYKVENLIFLSILAVGQASTTFAGQNIGAVQYRRIRKGSIIMLCMGAGITIIVAGLILLFPNVVFRWFMKDPDVVANAISLEMVSFPFYWIYPAIEVFGGAIRSLGYSVTSMIVIIMNLCAVRIGLLYLFSKTIHTMRSLAAVYPITWATCAISFTVIFFLVIRKYIKKEIIS